MSDDFSALLEKRRKELRAEQSPADPNSFEALLAQRRAEVGAPAPRKGPTQGEAFFSGAGQGVTLGFLDEIAAGVVSATSPKGMKLGPAAQPAPDDSPELRGLKEAALSQEASQVDPLSYRALRDRLRRGDAEASEAFPKTHLGGELAGAAATAMLAPASAKAQGARLLPRLMRAGVVRGAPVGAAYGLGASEAETVGGAAADTGLGAAGGIAGGIGGELLAIGGGKLANVVRRRASKGIAENVAAEQARQAALADKATRSAQGEYRSSVQSASRMLENLEREARELPGELGDKARAYLQTPEALALREQVVRNSLGTAPERLAEMEAKKVAHATLAAGRDEAVEAMTGEALRSPVRKHVVPRFVTIAQRAIPLTVGATVGGAEGAFIGGIVSLTMGAPGRTLQNMIRKPAVRMAFWQAVQKASGGGPETGAIIKGLEHAAQRGPEAFATAISMTADSPIGAAILQQLEEPRFGPEAATLTDDERARALAKALRARKE